MKYLKVYEEYKKILYEKLPDNWPGDEYLNTNREKFTLYERNTIGMYSNYFIIKYEGDMPKVADNCELVHRTSHDKVFIYKSSDEWYKCDSTDGIIQFLDYIIDVCDYHM